MASNGINVWITNSLLNHLFFCFFFLLEHDPFVAFILHVWLCNMVSQTPCGQRSDRWHPVDCLPLIAFHNHAIWLMCTGHILRSFPFANDFLWTTWVLYSDGNVPSTFLSLAVTFNTIATACQNEVGEGESLTLKCYNSSDANPGQFHWACPYLRAINICSLAMWNLRHNENIFSLCKTNLMTAKLLWQAAFRWQILLTIMWYNRFRIKLSCIRLYSFSNVIAYPVYHMA